MKPPTKSLYKRVRIIILYAHIDKMFIWLNDNYYLKNIYFIFRYYYLKMQSIQFR